MATDITTPAQPASKYVDPDRPTGKVLPALLLTVLVAGIAVGVWGLVTYIQGLQAGEALETNFVFRRLDTTVQINAQPNPLAFFVRTFPVALVIAGLVLLGIVCRNGTQALKLWGPVVGGALVAFAILLFILRRTLPGKEIEGSLFWLSIVIPILALGLFYSVWMYLRDGQAVGWAWASFLGTLRCVVYILLAGVFLLPALQTWEKSEAVSKFLVLVDLSGSMNISDELATDERAMPTRLDEVAQFLLRAEADAKADPKGPRTEPLNFLQKLQKKVPVVYYGFGGKLDDEFKEFKGDKTWTEADLKAWLRMDVKHWLLDGLTESGKEAVTRTSGFEADKPATQDWAAEWAKAAAPEFKDPADKATFDAKKEKLPKRLDLRQQMLTGSNYGDSLLAMITRESNSMLAGVLIIGDGNSNQGSPSTYDEIRRRAANLKVPVFAIGVGQERKQIHIRITDLQAPEQAPPDDKFLVRVEVDGEGLADQDFEVFLDVYDPKDPKKPVLQLKATSKFKLAPGSVIPHGQVEFGIDPADEQLASLMVEDKMTGKRELREGEWRFVARIAKAKGESFVGKEHVSDPAAVQVVKRPLRILLFAGGPTREYQFVRRLLVNEVDKKRAELSIYLQVTDQKGARVQDVPQERLLKQFPDTLRPPGEGTPDEKYYNLGQYDVIVAFDPDWSQVSEASLKLVQEWVKDQAGGLVLLGGPINTWQLARRGGNFDKLRPIVDLYPVRVEDSRLAGQNLDRPTTEPWRLNFRNLSDETAFLKLDEEDKKNPIAGWEEFFAGTEKPTRGFYAYYPVKSVKPGATILATYTDPRGRITREDDPNKTDEQPYIVTMPFGGGKVVYLSSGEFWRLRLYKEMFHERFWTKLGRYVASGTQLRQTSRGVLVMARQFTAGQQVRLEARLRGIDLKPLAMGSEVKIKVTPPEGVVMKPDEFKLEPKKEGEWDGWFRGRFEAKAPGEYRIDLSIPGTNDTLTKKFLVKESNPELDNVKPNFALLYELASSITALRGDTGDLKQQLRASLRPELLEKAPRDDAGKESDLRLFFDLKTGKLVPDQVKPERRTNRSRGPVDDLWDEGPTIGKDQSGKPRVVSLVLLLAVGLLSAEWLTRKLLKLA